MVRLLCICLPILMLGTAPLYADKPALDNTLSLRSYKSFSEDLIDE